LFTLPSRRRQEQAVLSSARHAPDEVHAFQYDDTTAFAVPHFGNREAKHLCKKYRFRFVPWMVEDVARKEQHYIYSLKSKQDEAIGKGADRWFLQSSLFSQWICNIGTAGAHCCTRSSARSRLIRVLFDKHESCICLEIISQRSRATSFHFLVDLAE
jgi:hypothetical protein